MTPHDTKELLDRVISGDISALGQAITIVESDHADHRSRALELIGAALEIRTSTIRIAISGIPGAGKSTLIDTLGIHLIDKGKRVAVLAVDPSSPVSGGSILGDKTRMDRLAVSSSAFVRPSPSGGVAGGVTRSTRESIILCEAAGFDVVIVETVGVGQAELAVHSMVDIFVLLSIAGAGDELQGIKRGILELADIILVTKADGDNEARAEATRSNLRGIINLLPHDIEGWQRRVRAISTITGNGLDQFYKDLDDLSHLLTSRNLLAPARSKQLVQWFEDTVVFLSSERIRNNETFKHLVKRISDGSIEDNPARIASTFVDSLFD